MIFFYELCHFEAMNELVNYELEGIHAASQFSLFVLGNIFHIVTYAINDLENITIAQISHTYS